MCSFEQVGKMSANDDRTDSAAVIADVLREQFGDEAQSIAAAQLEHSEPESREAWQKVLNRLQEA